MNRLWRDGPASRKSPHVRYSSATNISDRIACGYVCSVGCGINIPNLSVNIPTLFRKERERRMGHPTQANS
jgi:hypothetical protein